MQKHESLPLEQMRSPPSAPLEFSGFSNRQWHLPLGIRKYTCKYFSLTGHLISVCSKWESLDGKNDERSIFESGSGDGAEQGWRDNKRRWDFLDRCFRINLRSDRRVD